MSTTSDSIELPEKFAQLLTDRFRCSEGVANFTVSKDLSNDSGYFRWGSDTICYGQCSSGIPTKHVTDPLHDAGEYVTVCGSTAQVPFDPDQVVENLRCERYFTNAARLERRVSGMSLLRKLYYLVRPFMPIGVRKHFQKIYLRGWDKTPFPRWPVDRTIENIHEQFLILSMRSRKIEKTPFIWFWPDGAPSCAMLTHDVETSAGLDFCPQLMDLNDSFGIKTSFQFVPEKRYLIPQSLLETTRKRGFEVNIHDLNHDGYLFRAREEFLRRVEQINNYARQFGAVGFRSAALYRNVDWYDALDFSYDMSIPNVAHLDPQRGGCCTVMPFFIGKILELPLTTTQDYSLFHILNEYSTRLWKEQISLIRDKHGLISFIIHPDYILTERARGIYAELLQYLSGLRSQGETWIALPGEVAAWWRMRSQMNLVKSGSSWHIEGKGNKRARLAYAKIVDDTLRYEIE